MKLDGFVPWPEEAAERYRRAVPQWAVHDHRAIDGDAVLFSITDAPVLEKLGLQRVLPVDGPQEVAGQFTGA